MQVTNKRGSGHPYYLCSIVQIKGKMLLLVMNLVLDNAFLGAMPGSGAS